MSKRTPKQGFDNFDYRIESSLNSHRFGLLCRLAGRRKWKQFAKSASLHRLSRVEYEILTVLSEKSLSHRQSDVMDMVAADRAQFVEALRNLIDGRGNFIESDYEKDSADPVLKLTEFGQAMFASYSLFAERAGGWHEADPDVSNEDLITTMRVLARVAGRSLGPGRDLTLGCRQPLPIGSK